MAEKDSTTGDVDEYKKDTPQDVLAIMDAAADEAEHTKVYKRAKFKGDQYARFHYMHQRLLHQWLTSLR